MARKMGAVAASAASSALLEKGKSRNAFE